MTDPAKIGFLGLGRMGEPIAANLLAAGHSLVVFDIDPIKNGRLAALGAEVGVSPADVASRTGISFAIVMNDAVLRSVVLAPDGVVAGAATGHLFCDLSTVSLAVSADVAIASADAGVRYVRGKVVGSVQRAVEGTLTVLASGERGDYDAVRPLLLELGDQAIYVGAGDAANYLKLVHSVIVGVYAALLGEALTFGEKGGVNFEQMVDVLEAGPLASTQLTLKAATLRAREFDHPPSDIDTASKDLDLVLDAARAVAAPMPLTSAVRQVMASMQANGNGKKDIWGVLEAFESLAGISR